MYMLVTLDIKNESMKDSFLNFIGTLDYIDIKADDATAPLVNNNANKNSNKFSQFAGMWKDRDIDATILREKAWQR